MTAPVPLPRPEPRVTGERRRAHVCPTCQRSTLRTMTVKQAAAELGVSPMTVYRLIEDGELLARRFGRSLRIAAIDLDAYMDRAIETPESAAKWREVYARGRNRESASTG